VLRGSEWELFRVGRAGRAAHVLGSACGSAGGASFSSDCD
jgi:hypothetical protein